ncbi:hypothetical protein [Pseudomonas sp.]|uniref:hypothetical protein n=1 Tax=Pseudomonas sp. TaxID=306 RepID=UPI003FD8EE5C
MNIAISNKLTKRSNSFNASQTKFDSATDISDIHYQEYFSVCEPRPDLPMGNRFPYGVCGPFLDEDEAWSAMAIIQAQIPDRKLAIMVGCNHFEGSDEYLADDQERARAKLIASIKAE